MRVPATAPLPGGGAGGRRAPGWGGRGGPSLDLERQRELAAREWKHVREGRRAHTRNRGGARQQGSHQLSQGGRIAVLRARRYYRGRQEMVRVEAEIDTL